MSQLTQEEKRIKLAEWAGWKRLVRMGKEVLYSPEGGHVLLSDAHHHIPDYFNSLDECHILENTLLTTPQLDEEYYFALKRNHRATAAERAESIFQVISFFK
jgi:hypothetical protein